ncbi:MAG TPA: isoprenylcysteine carboxylmethyltransferase family protein [Rhizomicrobium sp.]|jgi:protein-S-isoprenylcysteine O-methyltransferase Ste14|nr:isoprenylcysteine carboxylmethyltransferase family protein [Rhizomicrobium sp.]
MSAELATNLLWVVWYVTWMAAALWSAKTKTQMKTDRCGVHRLLFTLGLLLLLVPPFGSGKPLFGVALLGWLSQRLWREPVWLEWALFALVVSGFAFCWWARLHLGRMWSGFVTLKEEHRVVETGPYGLVRHPIYTGIMFAALTTALMRATPFALLGFALVVAGLAMIASVEERFLRQQLGAESYDAYSRRVPMLIPMV